MQTPEEMLRECRTTWGAAVKDYPDGTISESTRTKRADYLNEEVREFHEAMAEGDIAHAAKEGIDICYIVTGSLVSMGVPVMECWEEVHRSNMTKTPAGDGKALKGPDFEAADIEPIIKRAMTQPREKPTADREPGQ